MYRAPKNDKNRNYLTASFSALPGLKTTDLEAAMVIGSLVRGLTPGRAARS